MFNGIATVMRARSPKTRLIAVQAAGAPAMVESWRSGRTIVHDTAETIADGVAVRVPVDEALTDMRGLIDDAILVGEATILDAMRMIHEHAGVVTEPSGALGVAALMENRDRFRAQAVGTVLCGGNLTTQQLREWL
jgi:threonine dehydratase